MLTALKNREYRYLWGGQAISHLGDQFHLVALPWLVLATTHDPLQLGLVLAVAGVPRAILMLVGGAVADRISPRLVMLVSDLLRFLIAGALAVAVFAGQVQLWMIYGLAIAFGTVSGFFLPAAEATLPRVVGRDELEGGNSLMMIASQGAQFIGPAVAGTIVAVVSGAAADAGALKGIAVAFAVDAATFAVSALSLLLMHPITGFGSDNHPLRDVADGLRYVAGNATIRTMVIIIALANFLLTGPMLVGIPVLASQRLPEGAAAFGMIISAYALGNLGGMGVAGGTRRPTAKMLGWIGTAIFPLFAVIYAALGLVTSTGMAVALMVVAGVANGYLAIIVISSLQRMAPSNLVGRVMSLLMLSMYGLGPISQAISGAILQLSLPGLFGAAAVGLVVPAVIAYRYRSIWDLAAAEPETPALAVQA
ncbi:MAG TPA: MFS transporter [Propionicimonas sp.]|uniref:MFS transporter n=1 Tax=Propionicimonas sp. TaxID=1955623 RepID=UPI002F414470